MPCEWCHARNSGGAARMLSDWSRRRSAAWLQVELCPCKQGPVHSAPLARRLLQHPSHDCLGSIVRYSDRRVIILGHNVFPTERRLHIHACLAGDPDGPKGNLHFLAECTPSQWVICDSGL